MQERYILGSEKKGRKFWSIRGQVKRHFQGKTCLKRSKAEKDYWE